MVLGAQLLWQKMVNTLLARARVANSCLLLLRSTSMLYTSPSPFFSLCFNSFDISSKTVSHLVFLALFPPVLVIEFWQTFDQTPWTHDFSTIADKGTSSCWGRLHFGRRTLVDWWISCVWHTSKWISGHHVHDPHSKATHPRGPLWSLWLSASCASPPTSQRYVRFHLFPRIDDSYMNQSQWDLHACLSRTLVKTSILCPRIVSSQTLASNFSIWPRVYPSLFSTSDSISSDRRRENSSNKLKRWVVKGLFWNLQRVNINRDHEPESNSR